MKANATNCGIAARVPHQSKLLNANRRQRRPNRMNVGMKEAEKIAFHSPQLYFPCYCS
jgi:hypothetical protein